MLQYTQKILFGLSFGAYDTEWISVSQQTAVEPAHRLPFEPTHAQVVLKQPVYRPLQPQGLGQTVNSSA